MSRAGHNRQAGFTMAELAMTVMVVGILITLGVATYTQRLQHTAYETTRQSLELIRETLIAYLARNQRLPCPDSDITNPDGLENRTTAGDVTSACSAAFGMLPYTTLGLPRTRALDGWDHFINYDVGHTSNWTISSNFSVVGTASLTVSERNSAGTLVNPGSANAVVVLISYGPNGLGAYTIKGTRNTVPDTGTDELNNADYGTAYVNREFSDNSGATGGAYDDLLTYMSVDDLTGPLIKDGSIKSALSQLQDTIETIHDAVFYHVAADTVDPDDTGTLRTVRHRLIYADNTGNGGEDVGTLSGFVPWSSYRMTSAEAVQDPWGQTIRYVVAYDNVASNSTSNDEAGHYNGMQVSMEANMGVGETIVYRLVSGGSDGTINTTLTTTSDCDANDYCFDIPYSHLISKMAKASIALDTR